jgi:hypothetical protein
MAASGDDISMVAAGGSLAVVLGNGCDNERLRAGDSLLGDGRRGAGGRCAVDKHTGTRKLIPI